jgi:crotonobetainyl-CoA:carnitine CoA-transferase CaiB-like acyl-CoA transferase
MLSLVRVVDLSDERGIFASFVLAELGADVVCVEPRGGSRSRAQAPFAGGARGAERSLFWWAYARGKRSVALDPEAEADRDGLLRLIDAADVLLESRTPGEMERLGLGYETLARRNPALVYVSVTPYGQTGPKARWAASDLTVFAAAGALWLMGDDDRAPVRISVPQAFLHAGAEAAAATLVALHERRRSGRGQHVDVSAQQAVTLATQSDIVSAALNSEGGARGGARIGEIQLRFSYPARDGHVSITHLFGNAFGPASKRLMEVVCEHGFCDERLRDKDWRAIAALIGRGAEPVATHERAKDAIAAWTASKTKAELLEIAMKRRLLVAPAWTLRDVAANDQLAARGYLQPLERPDGEGTARQLGAFVRQSGGSPTPAARRAPRLGEHTAAVLTEWSARERGTAAVAGPPSDGASSPLSGAARLPLAGVKILDFMWALAGPAATRMLADYGADVVRVESSAKQDPIRGGRPFVDRKFGFESGALFHGANASKRMLGLDLRRPGARDVVLDLVRWADVVCESFTAGAMTRMGLGYEVLREVNPDLVMLSTSLMGQTGPLAAFAGYGNLSAAIVGFHEMTGWPDRAASGPYGAYTDYVTPKFVAGAVLAALDRRDRTGEGVHLDLAQAEASLHFLAPALLDVLVNDADPSRRGNRDDRFAPHGCYPVAGDDQWLAIAVENDLGFRELSRALGREALADDARFRTADERQTNAEALDAAISELSRAHAGVELERRLQANGVACHLVQNSEAACADPQLLAREHFVRLESGDAYTIVEGTRSKLSRTPARIRRGVPTLGRDNWEILTELLGYDEARVAELAAAGVLE